MEAAEADRPAAAAVTVTNPLLPLARFAADWAPDAGSCSTPAVYHFGGRSVYTPDSRCVVFSSDPVGEAPEGADENGPLAIHLYCEAGAEGQLPVAWPMPAPQLIDIWVIEPLGEDATAAVRVDRGTDGVLELVRCNS
ncbi:MAG: hypothetical protein KIS96_05600 [Bauldia sp.]|nr:hypothetical protein [Bauldia sp.]